MARSRKSKTESENDSGFQQSVLNMLEWLADRDPVRAATLISAYLDELAEEMSGQVMPAKG